MVSELGFAMATPPPKPRSATPRPEKKEKLEGSKGADGKKETGCKSPRRRPSRSPSTSRCRGSLHHDSTQPRERVVRDSGSSGAWPQLTKNNYNEWSLRMRLKLQARDLRDVIE